MIEFNGYLSGSAEKHFKRQERKLTVVVLVTTFCIFLPVAIYLSLTTENLIFVLALVFGVLFMSVLLIFPSKKVSKELLTKRIYTDEEFIVFETDKSEGYRRIEDASCVIDHGEFYEIVYPYGKKTNNFMCQKDLLCVGTIEEFELLFESKIIRKNADNE